LEREVVIDNDVKLRLIWEERRCDTPGGEMFVDVDRVTQPLAGPVLSRLGSVGA
jgi:hypothetical protein